MSDHTALREAAQEYAAAYAAHDSERDLAKALRLSSRSPASKARSHPMPSRQSGEHEQDPCKARSECEG